MNCFSKSTCKADNEVKMCSKQNDKKCNFGPKKSQIKKLLLMEDVADFKYDYTNDTKRRKPRPIEQLLQIIDCEIPIHELSSPENVQQNDGKSSEQATVIISAQESLTPGNATEYQQITREEICDTNVLVKFNVTQSKSDDDAHMKSDDSQRKCVIKQTKSDATHTKSDATQSKSDAAQSKSNAAQSKSKAAQSKSDSALSKSEAAQSTFDATQTKCDVTLLKVATKPNALIEQLLQDEEETVEIETETSNAAMPMQHSLSEIHDFLDQVEKTDAMLVQDAQEMKLRSVCTDDHHPCIDNVDEGSLQVTMLRQALQERTAHVHLLKDALYRANLEKTEALAMSSKEQRKAIHKLKSDNEIAIKKLQDTINKLLGDKKKFMEKIESLLQQIRTMEGKHQSQLQALQQRHLVDIERVKQFANVAEKVRRERWIERQTARIKELTVKGLEPELTKLNLQHESNVAQIKAAHAIELRTQAEASARQLHQLQIDLTREKEDEIERVKATLTERFDRELAEVRAANEQRCERLSADSAMEISRNRSLWMAQQDAAHKSAQQEMHQVKIMCEQKISHLKEQQQKELEETRRKFHEEQQRWKASQSRIYVEKLDAKLQEMRAERDAEIERAIEQLESDEKKIQAELENEMENKIKRLKDQHMAVLADRDFTNVLLKNRLEDVQNTLQDMEKQLLSTRASEGRLREELCISMQRVESLEAEQSRVREQVKKEFETQLVNLEAALQHQKAKRRAELDQVHARLKTILENKAQCIVQLKKQITEANDRCLHLENLLAHQTI